MHGCTECWKFCRKRDIVMCISVEINVRVLTQCFLVTYEFFIFIQMVKVNLSCWGNWILITSSEIPIREPALSRLSELKSSQSIEISCRGTASLVVRIFFDILLTVHLSIFISVFNQLGAQNLFYTYRRDDTRGCLMQFWPPDDEHMCSKHVEAWNKFIVKQIFYIKLVKYWDK